MDQSGNDNGKEFRGALKHIPALMGCRGVDCFARLNTIDEGTYGVVHRARDKKTGEIVALKKIKMEKAYGGFPITSLREINILMSIQHPNVVSLKEIVVGHKLNSIYMVMEYMDHDLKMLMKTMKDPFRQAEVKCLLKQLLLAVEAMHSHWILHRDLKTSNLLLNNHGVLKVCDYGLARKYGDPIGRYTQLVVTLWYRAPELLLGAKTYTTAIDMWSVGCIFYEFLTKEPMLPGKGEFDQIDRMFKLLSTPTEETWSGWTQLPHAKNFKWKKYPHPRIREKFPKTSYHGGPYLSDVGFDLLTRMLCFDPKKRITASDALKHDYFKEMPHPQDPSMMRTFPSLNEGSRRRKQMKNADGDALNDLRVQRERVSEGFFMA